MINRSLIMVTPQQPFLDWLHATDPTSLSIGLATLQEDPSVFLITACDDESELRQCLPRFVAAIF